MCEFLKTYKELSSFIDRRSFIHELHVIGFIDKQNLITNIEDRVNISELLNNSDLYYTTFSIPKKYNNGVRHITSPKESLKGLQKILDNAIKNQLNMNHFKFGKYDQAFQKKKGIFLNAQIHRNKKYILHVDLKDFFSSIHFGRVSGFFYKNHIFELNRSMSYFFADLLCYKGILPQGAPTSPIIANLIGEKLDTNLLNLCKKYHFNYTRYADDLTFSTNDVLIVKNKLNFFISELDGAVANNGFKINWEKFHIDNPTVRHTVTGLSNNIRVSSKSEFYKRTRAMADSFYMDNTFFDAGKEYNGYTQSLLKKALQVLEGRFAFIKDIEDKNRNLYISHKSGDEYHKITAVDFKEHHYIPDKIDGRIKFPAIYSGKIYSYSKFIFFKVFLSGEYMNVFVEGKTDSRYIKTANKALKTELPLKFIDFETQNNKGTQFSTIFNLNRGGDGLRKLLEMYTGSLKFDEDDPSLSSRLISYWSYFKKKLIPIKPNVILLDFELSSNNKPLSKMINCICNFPKIEDDKKTIKDKLIKTGFYHVLGNLYIATTTDLTGNTTERAIEDYFPDEFLNDPFGNKTVCFENAPCIKKDSIKKKYKTIRKNDFSLYIRSLSNKPQLFSNFECLLKIFDSIKYDYEYRVLNKINVPNKSVMNENALYKILDSKFFKSDIENKNELKIIFLDILKNYGLESNY